MAAAKDEDAAVNNDDVHAGKLILAFFIVFNKLFVICCSLIFNYQHLVGAHNLKKKFYWFKGFIIQGNHNFTMYASWIMMIINNQKRVIANFFTVINL